MHVQIMNQFNQKTREYKAIERYWKLIQQDSRKLSDKRFCLPAFRMYLTNKEILDKLWSYSAVSPKFIISKLVYLADGRSL